MIWSRKNCFVIWKDIDKCASLHIIKYCITSPHTTLKCLSDFKKMVKLFRITFVLASNWQNQNLKFHQIRTVTYGNKTCSPINIVLTSGDLSQSIAGVNSYITVHLRDLHLNVIPRGGYLLQIVLMQVAGKLWCDNT